MIENKTKKILLFIFGFIAAAGLALWIVFAAFGWRALWLATYVNFLFTFNIASGLFMWTVLMSITRAGWAREIEYRSAAAIGYAIPSLIFWGILWAGSSVWAPWNGKSFPSGAYLNTSFLFARDMFIMAVFWILGFFYMKNRGKARAGLLGGIITFFYLVGFTFLAIDMIEALDPPWRSSFFGPYFFVNALYAGVIVWALSSIKKAETMVLHDLSSLLVATSLFTTYAFFTQLITYWYENVPREITFIIPRYNYEWKWVSLALIMVLYLGPLFLLILWKLKVNRLYVTMVCILLLCAQWVESWWWVVPGFIDKHIQFNIAYGAGFLLMGGVFLLSYTIMLPFAQRMYSRRDSIS